MTTRARKAAPKKQHAPALSQADPSASPIDRAVGFEIGKTVNLPQIKDEISAAGSVEIINVALTGPTDSSAPVGAGNLATLWISPGSVDAQVVADAVQAHSVNPNWGIPQVLLDFNAVLLRLRDDPEANLSSPDVEALVRGMAIQFTAILPRG